MCFEVTEDGFPDGLAKPDGNGVANHFSGLGERYGLLLGTELVIGGECLEEGSLAEADGAVLLRMPETAIAIAEELGGDGGSGSLPFHPSVNTGVILSHVRPVALGNEVFRPVPPASARLGGLDPLFVQI